MQVCFFGETTSQECGASVATRSVSTFPFVAVVRDAGDGLLLRHSNDFFDGSHFNEFPNWQVKWVSELTGYMAGVAVVMYPAVYKQEFPLVRSSVVQATGWYFMFTWDIAGVLLLLFTYSGVSADIPWLTVLVLLFPSCLVSVSGGVEGLRSRPH